MANLQQHRIAACKFDYQYLGKDLSSLAIQYGFPLQILEDEGWERKIEPTLMPETTDMQQFADQLEKITRSKLSIISLFRQIDNQSLYAELEKAILDKCLEAVTDLEASDPRVSSQLMNITKTLVSVQERNPIQLADNFKDTLKTQGSQVIVNIANDIN